jgi:hypothetical protein
VRHGVRSLGVRGGPRTSRPRRRALTRHGQRRLLRARCEHHDHRGVRSRDTGNGVCSVAPTADATLTSISAASHARTTKSARRASLLGPAGPFARTSAPTTTKRRGHRPSSTDRALRSRSGFTTGR